MTADKNLSTVVSAPGKIVLSGEYSVLDGAPAIAMAVNRRARVSIEIGDGTRCRVTAPGFSTHVGQFDTGSNPLNWLQSGADYSLVEAVWNRLTGPLPMAASMQLDTRSFVDADSGLKLGLGSSAALCVALALALQKDSPDAAVAFEAHRDFQQGSGSGADIACSVQGGLLRYEMNDRKVQSLTWPIGLHYQVLWSGTAADTRSKIARLKLGGADVKESRRHLAAVSSDVAECWQADDAVSLLKAYDEFVTALWQFDVDHLLGIFDGGHAQMLEVARSAGIIYKPCGAGGGDVGILLSSDKEKLSRFVERHIFDRHIGSFTALDCELDSRGAIPEHDVEFVDD